MYMSGKWNSFKNKNITDILFMSKTKSKTKRSFFLKLLILAFMLLSLMGWLRLEQALQYWTFLKELGISPGPFYIAFGGALWGTAGLASALALWLRQPYAPLLAGGTAVFCTLWYWADRLFLAQNSLVNLNWPFALIINLGLLFFVFLVLALPRQKSFFNTKNPSR